MRLRTLPLAASSILTGSAAGWNSSSRPWLIFTLALVTTFLLQILSNLANDFGDFKSGVDNQNRVGPIRAMQSGSINKKEMTVALAICSLAALISGILLLKVSFSGAHMLWTALCFLGVGLIAIIAAFKYTIGKRPYGYIGLGDLAVFLFFGVVGVGGSFFLHSNEWDLKILIPSAAIGLFSAAVLNLNNLRDHINDKVSGKITLVVRLGYEKGKVYQVLLVVAAVVCAIIWSLIGPIQWISFFAILPALLQLALLPKVFRTKEPSELDGELKKVALLTFFYGLILFLIAILTA